MPITPPSPPEHTRSIATGSYPVPVGPHYTCRSLFLWVDRYVYPQTGYWSAPVERTPLSGISLSPGRSGVLVSAFTVGGT